MERHNPRAKPCPALGLGESALCNALRGLAALCSLHGSMEPETGYQESRWSLTQLDVEELKIQQCMPWADYLC